MWLGICTAKTNWFNLLPCVPSRNLWFPVDSSCINHDYGDNKDDDSDNMEKVIKKNDDNDNDGNVNNDNNDVKGYDDNDNNDSYSNDHENNDDGDHTINAQITLHLCLEGF